jgi:dTDP-4-amino-4,6-dideoxygalactose transaminase
VNVPFVDLKAQTASLQPELDQVLQAVVASGAFIQGPPVRQFEDEFAAFCQARHAVAVDTGTAALELALRALDIGPGDEVITVANTFIATVLAIAAVGARPVLVDVDPATYNLTAELVAPALTARTRAIIPVHLYGQPVDLDPVLALADRHGLFVVEDACQAHGARYRGRRVGALGTVGAFSFYPSKNLGAFGDGGMLVTNSPEIAQRLRLLREYGQSEKYVHQVKGYNHRLDTLQAAVLRVKLPCLDRWNAARREHAAAYARLLGDTGLVLPKAAEYAEHVYHLYVVCTSQRDALQAYLREHGVSTGIHYPIPIHRQQAMSDLGYQPGDFPVTERLAAEGLSLPMFAELTPEQIGAVAGAVQAFATAEAAHPQAA